MKTSYDSALRSLDAAVGIPDDIHRRRASTLVERIVATPTMAAPTRAGRRRAPRRVAFVAALAAAAITIGTLELRGTTDSGGVAYASWTAVPSAVAVHDLDTVVRACRKQLDDGTIPVALAERRGNFVALLFHGDNPDLSASCVAWHRRGSSQVDDVSTAIGGSSGPAWTPAAGRITEGPISQLGGDSPASFTDGAVGRGVVAVTIHAGGQTITATVKNGRYAAWWPGRAFSDGPPAPSGEGGPEPLLTYDVHLADGTVKKDVAPARPR
jgi:hypothetical protein